MNHPQGPPDPEMAATRARWDARYREEREAPPPAAVLTTHGHLLPPAGNALDLACGLGSNALWLAARGFTVHAWDLSPIAIAHLRRRAAQQGLPLMAEVREIVGHPPEADRFDIVVVSRFWEPCLNGAILRTLRPGGMLFYQTFTREHVGDHGPTNPAFRLEENELLHQFVPPLRLLSYREEGRVGNLSMGWRDEAWLVAMRGSESTSG